MLSAIKPVISIYISNPYDGMYSAVRAEPAKALSLINFTPLEYKNISSYLISSRQTKMIAGLQAVSHHHHNSHREGDGGQRTAVGKGIASNLRHRPDTIIITKSK